MKSLLHLNKLILSIVFLSTLIFNNLFAATSIDIWEKKENEKKDTATQDDKTIKSPILSGDTNKIAVRRKKYGEIMTPFGTINSLKYKESINICEKKNHFCLIRPEDVKFSKQGLKCRVLEKSFLGDSWEYKVIINKKFPLLRIRTDKGYIEKNDFVKLKINTKKILVFSK